MQKEISIFFLGILLVGLSVHFLDDYVKIGQEAEVRVSVYNNNPYDIDDVKIKVDILDTILASSSFDVDDYDGSGSWFHYRIPKNTRKGHHLVKITASNDDFRDVEYRYLTVV